VILGFPVRLSVADAGRGSPRPRGRALVRGWVVKAVPEEITTADKVGNVSPARYAEIVAELRKLVE
jgi:hypothetical protein